jgi:hypothetical protein
VSRSNSCDTEPVLAQLLLLPLLLLLLLLLQ